MDIVNEDAKRVSVDKETEPGLYASVKGGPVHSTTAKNLVVVVRA